jgi:hypothetical protein
VNAIITFTFIGATINPPIKTIVGVLMVNVSYTKLESDKDFFVKAYWSNMVE